MVILLRIYKRWDLDILALIDKGYPVRKMMKEALIAYSKGTPIKFELGNIGFFDMNNRTSCRMQITLSNDETDAIYLLKNIKHRYKNAFVKTVFRNSLITQNTAAMFSKPNDNLFDYEKNYLEQVKEGNYKIIKVEPLSDEELLDLKDKQKDEEKAKKDKKKEKNYTKKNDISKNTEEKVEVKPEPKFPNISENEMEEYRKFLEFKKMSEEANKSPTIENTEARDDNIADSNIETEILSDDETDAMMQGFSGLL